MWVKGSGSDLATMGAGALHRPAHGRGAAADRALRDERRGHGRLPRALPARPRDAARLDRDAAARLRPGAARPPHPPGRHQRARRARPTASGSCTSASATRPPGSRTSGPASRSPSRSARPRAPTRTSSSSCSPSTASSSGATRPRRPTAGRSRSSTRRSRSSTSAPATRRASAGRIPRAAQVATTRARRCCASCCRRSAARSRASAPSCSRVDTSPRSVEFVSSAQAEQLVTVGAPCPDHLVHTKRVPLWIPYDPETDDADALRARIAERAEAFRADYRAYVERSRRRDDGAGRPGPADRAGPAPRARLDRHDDEELDRSRATSTTARSR